MDENMKSTICLSVMIISCLLSIVAYAKTQTAIFAGGCFWSMQHDFDKVHGVLKTTVGYTGGHVSHPTYEQVSKGDTGHYEAIEIVYDSAVISYSQLLSFYLHDIDPTDDAGQFCDNGNEYKPVIFYSNAMQQKFADQMLNGFITAKRFNVIAVNIKTAQPFYPAEEYHQKYAEKYPMQYSLYRSACGRDQRLQTVWGK
jgi:peptide-methionine (S)-S-oxide reductase